MKDTKRKIII